MSAGQEPAPDERSVERGRGGLLLPGSGALDDGDLRVAQRADRVDGKEGPPVGKLHESVLSADGISTAKPGKGKPGDG
jgi:hypothetical protein